MGVQRFARVRQTRAQFVHDLMVRSGLRKEPWPNRRTYELGLLTSEQFRRVMSVQLGSRGCTMDFMSAGDSGMVYLKLHIPSSCWGEVKQAVDNALEYGA